MYDKSCPLRVLAGYVNGKEACDECCALYVETKDHAGCALAVLAEAVADKSEN